MHVADAPVNVVGPSSVSEWHDNSSLLYLFDSPPEEESDERQLEALLENELLADAMGRRLLAMSGYEIDEDLLAAEQYLLARSAYLSPREADELYALPDLAGPSSLASVAPRRSEFLLGGPRSQSYRSPYASGSRSSGRLMRPQPRRRSASYAQYASAPDEYRVLPGGYVSIVTRTPLDEDMEEAEEEEDEDEEEDETELGDDEDYMDYLGSQLLSRTKGDPCWIIDSRGAGDDDNEDDVEETLVKTPLVEERASAAAAEHVADSAGEVEPEPGEEEDEPPLFGGRIKVPVLDKTSPEEVLVETRPRAATVLDEEEEMDLEKGTGPASSSRPRKTAKYAGA